MILYNVTVNIEQASAAEWLDWMRNVHIPEVMATGYFVKNQIGKVLDEEDNGGETYAVQYYANSMDDLMAYHRNHAPVLQEKHTERYKNKFVAFRTVLEIV